MEMETTQTEVNWQLFTGLNTQTLQAAIETIIYLSDSPISIEKIKEKIDPQMPIEVVIEAIQELQKTFENSIHGLRLAQISGGYQFRTRPAYASYAKQMVKTQSLNLGTTALEVMAIIAYKGPITRMEVDQIRGVDSSHILRGLLDKKLVALQPKDNHSYYSVTSYFFEFFGLNSLNDLPAEHEIEALIAQSEVGAIKDIKELVSEYVPEDLDKSELEELDTLSKTIRDTISETDFSKELHTPGEMTSFEILEKYTVLNEIIQENQKASQSMYDGLALGLLGQ